MTELPFSHPGRHGFVRVAAAIPEVALAEPAENAERIDIEHDLSDEEKTLFLDTLWSIILSFIELGFGVHPIQQACGKDSKNASKPALSKEDMIHSDFELPEEFIKRFAQLETDEAEEGLEL